MTTNELIFNLISSKKLSIAEVAKATEISPVLFTQWKAGRQKPSTEALSKLADYFNVSVDYLLGRTDDPTPISSLHIPETVANVPLAFSDGLEGLSQESLDDIAKYIEFVKQRDANKNK